jgi:hypothetical protein
MHVLRQYLYTYVAPSTINSKLPELGSNRAARLSQLWYTCQSTYLFLTSIITFSDRLCGLVVRVSGCRSRGPEEEKVAAPA